MIAGAIVLVVVVGVVVLGTVFASAARPHDAQPSPYTVAGFAVIAASAVLAVVGTYDLLGEDGAEYSIAQMFLLALIPCTLGVGLVALGRIVRSLDQEQERLPRTRR